MATKGYPSAQLITEWNASNSLEEVSQRTGLKINNLHQRRNQLAKRGITLKVFPSNRGGNRLDVAALQALGQQTLPEGAKAFVPTTRPKVEAPQAPQGEQTEQTSEAAAS